MVAQRGSRNSEKCSAMRPVTSSSFIRPDRQPSPEWASHEDRRDGHRTDIRQADPGICEYRIFATLARFSALVREAAVSLTPVATGHSVVCSVRVHFEHGVPVTVTARGRHAYDAINRVAYRIGPMLTRHAHVNSPF